MIKAAPYIAQVLDEIQHRKKDEPKTRVVNMQIVPLEPIPGHRKFVEK
jgi:hypothetical protein